MKYRKKLLIYSLLAGLTILINSCSNGKPSELQLLDFKILDDFPSASAIEYDDGRLYVFGDDASYLLILDSAWNQLDTIHYSDDTSYRINKSIKPDIESAAILHFNNEKHLYALGSFATEARKKLLYGRLPSLQPLLVMDSAALVKGFGSIEELNIEGMAFARSKFVLANRANKTYKTNRLVILDHLLEKNASPPFLIDLVFDSARVIGVSGLFYQEENDMLFFTASEEDTKSATEDGEIGDSYLGWINDFSKKMNETSVRPDQLFNLSQQFPQLVKQKIESLCIDRSDDNEVSFHLVADNDQGQSALIRLLLKW